MSDITHQFIDASQVSQFSDRDRAHMMDPGQFKEFMSYDVSKSSFADVARNKATTYSKEVRQTMQAVLFEQFTQLELSNDQVTHNLKSLSNPNTFAIITAHQPCLMTGPLYFIYKICSAVSLAKDLNIKHSEFHFVPMYVVGSEDHDFEEIQHLTLYGNRLEWTNERDGAVGRMKLSGIEELVDEVSRLLGTTPFAESLTTKLRQAYNSKHTLAQATARFIYDLFGDHGVVVADLDDHRLKVHAQSIFRTELTDGIAQIKTLENQSKLELLGYSPQIYARPINLFYLTDEKRDKIERNGDVYEAGELSFSELELMDELDRFPERFSPNVVLRPVYQQLVLPGLAYIGGGAEVAYWMEIKGAFEAFNVEYPIVLRRDSAMWIKPHTSNLLMKCGINIEHLFSSLHEAQTQYLQEHADEDWSLNELKEEFSEVYVKLTAEIVKLDPGLQKMIQGQEAQHINFMDKLEGRMKKFLKSQHEVSMTRLEKIWEDLFRGNSLQERKDNFMPMHARLGSVFIDTLIANFNPLKPGMHVFREGNSE